MLLSKRKKRRRTRKKTIKMTARKMEMEKMERMGRTN